MSGDSQELAGEALPASSNIPWATTRDRAPQSGNHEMTADVAEVADGEEAVEEEEETADVPETEAAG